MKIFVIGAGITGITTAYSLAKRGHQVVVYEQESYPAMRTSYANGGQLSVSNSETWNTWSNVGKGLKWMFTKDAPLLIRPTPSWSKIKWLTKFLYHTYKGHYHKNTANTIELGLKARELYQQIIEEENLEFDFSPCGILHFYKNESYFNKAKDAEEIYNLNNVTWKIIDRDEIYAIEPAMKEVGGMLGGVWTPEDSTGDIHKFCVELEKVLVEKYGVQFHYYAKVDDLLLSFLEGPVVVTAGVGSVKLARMFGDNLPIYPVKGYSITIELDEESAKHAPKVSLLDDQAKIVTATLGNRLRVAGTAELAGENYDIRRDRIEPLLRWVHDNFPDINTRNYSSWACLRPMTPDLMPIIKKGRH